LYDGLAGLRKRRCEACLARPLALLLASAGCGGGSGAPKCTPGMQVACPCPDGRSSVQACGNDGRYGVCSCGGAVFDAGGPPGSGGSGGAGGSGGTTAPDAGVVADAPTADTPIPDIRSPDVTPQPPGSTACTDGRDNDGDGLIDSLDPDCTGAHDNDEATFGTATLSGEPGCFELDCYFDANSTFGDDGCQWNLRCDPTSSGANRGCPYDPLFRNCATQQSATCLSRCLPIVPNGCDCFGCCAVTRSGNTFSVQLGTGCTYRDLADPTKCGRCTIQTSCFNPCDTCELCLDRIDLPASCPSVSCPAGVMPCGSDGHSPSVCPAGTRCLTGCCVQFN
jgi:hypothetical protein